MLRTLRLPLRLRRRLLFKFSDSKYQRKNRDRKLNRYVNRPLYFPSICLQVNLCQACGLIAACFIVSLPLIYEVIEVRRAVKRKAAEERFMNKKDESKTSLMLNSKDETLEISNPELVGGENNTAVNTA